MHSFCRQIRANKFAEGGVGTRERVDDVPLSRIQAFARGASLKWLRWVNKNFKLYLCALRQRCVSKMFETLAFSTLFYFVNEKALILVVYLCRRLRFELRSADRLSLAHTGVDQWLLILWVGEIPPKLPNQKVLRIRNLGVETLSKIPDVFGQIGNLQVLYVDMLTSQQYITLTTF